MQGLTVQVVAAGFSEGKYAETLVYILQAFMLST